MHKYLFLLNFLCLPAFAMGNIVDTAFVAEAVKRGAVIWDVRAAADYQKGHIPGAINLGGAAQALRNPNTEDFLPTAQIEKTLGAAGLDPAKEIIVYSTRGDANAYFGLYTIRYFGGTRGHVYHDGIDGWRTAGQEISTNAPKLPAVALKLTTASGVSVDTPQMLAAQKRGVQIIDARTIPEFSGNDIRAIRGGHIPGAINIPYEQNWVDPDTALKLARKQVADNAGMSLKSEQALKKLYAALDPEKETIVYCQSGTRASETAVVLSKLGFKNVKVYEPSWLGYAAVLSAPANNETFFNVGALNTRLSAMQQRIEQLERELTAAKARQP
jgi:thiosulfate/3-mercaptopyruvate sulfurtransferase